MTRKEREKQLEGRIKMFIKAIATLGILLQGLGTFIQSLK